MVTIKQIAQRVGISPSTVSIVLGGKAEQRKISVETQQKIIQAAMPNIPAASCYHTQFYPVPIISLFPPARNHGRISAAILPAAFLPDCAKQTTRPGSGWTVPTKFCSQAKTLPYRLDTSITIY